MFANPLKKIQTVIRSSRSSSIGRTIPTSDTRTFAKNISVPHSSSRERNTTPLEATKLSTSLSRLQLVVHAHLFPSYEAKAILGHLNRTRSHHNAAGQRTRMALGNAHIRAYRDDREIGPSFVEIDVNRANALCEHQFHIPVCIASVWNRECCVARLS